MIVQALLFCIAVVSSYVLWRTRRGFPRFCAILSAVYALSVFNALLDERQLIASYAVPVWAAGPMLWAGWIFFRGAIVGSGAGPREA